MSQNAVDSCEKTSGKPSMPEDGLLLLSEIHGPEVPPTYSLYQILEEGLKKNPKGICLTAVHEPGSHLQNFVSSNANTTECLSWTYEDLSEAADKLVTLLRGKGIRRGSSIVVFLYNSIEWALFLWAAAKLRAIFVPLNPRIVERREELKHVLLLTVPSVVVASDQAIATALDEFGGHSVVRITCDNISVPEISEWIQLSTLELETPLIQLEISDCEEVDDNADDIALVVFTSGTTKLPKGCPHTARNLGSATQNYATVRQIEPRHKCALVSPMFHMASISNILGMWRAGGSIVLPSEKFDAEAVLSTIQNQGCTHLPSTPSAVYGLIGHPSFELYKLQTLQIAELGATLVTPEHVRVFEAKLGAKVYPGWGMSEGNLTLSWRHDVDISSKNGVLGVGRVMSGAKVRICAPGTSTPLPCNEVGQLHCAGTTNITNYLGENEHDTEVFYTDNSGRWFCTGDQAFMDETGVVYIIGRIKDIIIRGGENISPAVIESCLDSTSKVQSQVIAMDDPIVGQVPVAVVRELPPANGQNQSQSSLKQELHKVVSEKLGKSFALADVLTLQELGLNDFPVTATGKIRKVEIAHHVNTLMTRRRESRTLPDDTVGKIQRTLTSVWSELIGVDAQQLDISRPITDLADSLTIMRFCYEIDQALNQTLSVSEILRNPTIDDQTKLIKRKQRITSKADISTNVQAHPDEDEDTEFSETDITLSSAFTSEVSSKLNGLGLSWEKHVAYHIRNPDWNSVWTAHQRPMSFNFRSAYELRDKSITASQLRRALEVVITRHATLRSIFVKSHHNHILVVLKPCVEVFNLCIHDVNLSPGMVSKTGLHSSSFRFAGKDKPVYQAEIGTVANNGVFFIHTIQHTAFDAVSVSGVLEDLDLLLAGSNPKLPTRTPFRLYANAYHSHRHSAVAQRAIEFHSARLKGIDKLQASLWPKSKGPCWFIHDDSGWCDAQGNLGDESKRRKLNSAEERIEVPKRMITVETASKLRTEYSIELSTVYKTAVALFNCEMTGQTCAVFTSTNAGRRWPFLEDWIVAKLPNPLMIAGPTLEQIVEVIDISGSMTCMNLMSKIQEDQSHYNTHAHVPWKEMSHEVISEELMHDVCQRQVFNWIPSARDNAKGSPQNLKFLAHAVWSDFGFLWNAGLVDAQTIFSNVLFDNVHISCSEASLALDRVCVLIRWLTTPENWSKEVRQCALNGTVLHPVLAASISEAEERGPILEST